MLACVMPSPMSSVLCYIFPFLVLTAVRSDGIEHSSPQSVVQCLHSEMEALTFFHDRKERKFFDRGDWQRPTMIVITLTFEAIYDGIMVRRAVNSE